jgi:hypothetical protein
MSRLRFKESSVRRVLLFLLLVLCVGGLAGCAYLAGAFEQNSGKKVLATYTGMDDKSVAIVTDVDPATALEYVSARAEIGAFVTAQFQQNMPKVKLLRYQDVIRWQDDTLQWQGLREKEIGKHFSVDRVLYIELLDYRTREPGATNLLRGRIHALARVFEVETPGPSAVWEKEFDVFWPPLEPQDVLHSNDTAVRKRVLEYFSEDLVGQFYDHRRFDPSVREQAE